MNLKALLTKYGMFIRYVIIGGLTTLINFIVFFALKHLGVQYMVANTIAWLASVIFAFFTNKSIVFKSDAKAGSARKELILFFVLRGVSLLLDDGIMFVGISLLHWPTPLVKILDQLIVIISNYIFSKLIFIHPEED